MVEALDRHLAAALRGEAVGWPDSHDGFATGAAWDRISFHGIAGLLAARPEVLSDWPEELRRSILDEARMQAFWEESHRQMLVALLAGLAGRGVEPLLMKGSALAYWLYPEPSARRRGDSDLLVGKPQLATTRAVLAGLGFTRRDDPHGLFFQETWLLDTGIGLIHAIDLHWQPTDSPALQKVLRVEEFFARPMALPRLSPHARAPHRVLTFLHGAINQASHAADGYYVDEQRLYGGGRLVWAWDNHLLAGQFGHAEWAELTELAITRDIAPVVLSALLLAQAACHTDCPDGVLAQLRAAPQDTILVKHIQNTNRISAFQTDYRALDSFGAKLSFALGHALADPRHLRRKYPGSAGWPIVFLHLRRIAEAALRLRRIRAR
jgi:hypothetical protein